MSLETKITCILPHAHWVLYKSSGWGGPIDIWIAGLDIRITWLEQTQGANKTLSTENEYNHIYLAHPCVNLLLLNLSLLNLQDFEPQ